VANQEASDAETAQAATTTLPGDRYGPADEARFRRMPSIVSDAQGRLVFAFSDGRVVVAAEGSDVGPPTRA
jgi:hypothetical protein